MICCLKYTSEGNILYKTDYDDDYQFLPQRPKNLPLFLEDPPKLYNERIPISKKKWTHLQEMKPQIPRDKHDFFNNIKYE